MRNVSRLFVRSVLMGATLVIASCSASSTTTVTQAPESQATASPETTATSTADNANATGIFTAQLVGGRTFDSAQILATQPLVLWFWAPG
ncbi:MAG: hypothetical protein HQ486_05110 [Acidimicrobiaceae bacterium]|nr:hypothetical protein [Acidimicrobiaceae bacterium]